MLYNVRALIVWRGPSDKRSRFQPAKCPSVFRMSTKDRRPTLEGKKDEERKIILFLGRVTDVIEEAEMGIGS